MIELLLTNTLESFPILSKLKANFAGHSKHILIVPDRFTLSYEKAALEFLELYGSFDIEVVSFSRLADKILQEKTKKMLNKQTEVMLLRKVVDDISDKLVCYRSVSNRIGFASEMYAVISSIRNSGVSTDALKNILPNLPTKIANKTSDIITIYYEYINALQKKYNDGTSKLRALADYIKDSDIAHSNVYISDFLSLTKVESDIVEQLMLNCLSTTICVVDGKGANADVYPKELVGAVERLARQNGLTVKTSRCDMPLGKDFSAIANELFGYGETKPSRGGQVSLARANSVSEEVSGVARKIARLVKVDKLRYKDIAVVCCDLAQYSELIEKTFSDFDIPYFFDKKQPLAKQSVCKLLLSGIRLVTNGFSLVNLMEFGKNSLLELDFDEICFFENYCLRFGIEYGRFFAPFQLGEKEDCARAEEVRKSLLQAVSPLNDKFGDVDSIINAIKKFFSKLDIEKKIDNLAKKQDENAMFMQAALTKQSLSALTNLIDEASGILGGSKTTLKNFCDIFTSALVDVEISNIPLNIDTVFVGEGQESRYENIKYMFVVGASNGVFPTESGDSGIVIERESSFWAENGVNVQPNVYARNKRERLGVLMLLLKPKEHLQVSFSKMNLLGEELHISSTIEYLREICGAEIEQMPSANEIVDNVDNYTQFCAVEKAAVDELFALKDKLDNREILPTDNTYKVLDCLYYFATKQKGKENIDKLFLGERYLDDQLYSKHKATWKNNATSPSQLEKFFGCPFCHFMDYILRVKERDNAQLEMSDLGTVLHAIAEKYFSESDCCNISDREIRERIKTIFDEYCQGEAKMQTLLAKPNGKSMERSILKRATDFIIEYVNKMQPSTFRPYKLEASFGFGDGYDAVKIQARDHKIVVHGIIDRIDKANDKFIIVDYKSKSAIDFSPSAILYGERCQMFIYLDALLENEKLTPAGVFYMLISQKFNKKEDSDKKYSYIGYVANDGDNFGAFDAGFYDDVDCKSKLFPIAKKCDKKNGVVMKGDILTTDELKQTGDYVRKMIARAVDDIDDGWIAPSPLTKDKDAKICAYCKYQELCQIDNRQEKVRRKTTYKQDEMIAIVGEKVDADGEEFDNAVKTKDSVKSDNSNKGKTKDCVESSQEIMEAKDAKLE
ncbi:MAG: PD-(D/E)XK nuclease family protein [Clostridia bacterium]